MKLFNCNEIIIVASDFRAFYALYYLQTAVLFSATK